MGSTTPNFAWPLMGFGEQNNNWSNVVNNQLALPMEYAIAGASYVPVLFSANTFGGTLYLGYHNQTYSTLPTLQTTLNYTGAYPIGSASQAIFSPVDLSAFPIVVLDWPAADWPAPDPHQTNITVLMINVRGPRFWKLVLRGAVATSGQTVTFAVASGTDSGNVTLVTSISLGSTAGTYLIYFDQNNALRSRKVH